MMLNRNLIKYVCSFLLIILNIGFGQVEENNLCIDNEKDQIYAIANAEKYEKIQDGEAFADFIFHVEKFNAKSDLEAKLYISKNISFNNEKIKFSEKTPYLYIIIKKGNNEPKILYGVLSWAGLKQEVDNFLKQK